VVQAARKGLFPQQRWTCGLNHKEHPGEELLEGHVQIQLIRNAQAHEGPECKALKTMKEEKKKGVVLGVRVFF
jgi:hypothetical protein